MTYELDSIRLVAPCLSFHVKRDSSLFVSSPLCQLLSLIIFSLFFLDVFFNREALKYESKTS